MGVFRPGDRSRNCPPISIPAADKLAKLSILLLLFPLLAASPDDLTVKIMALDAEVFDA